MTSFELEQARYLNKLKNEAKVYRGGLNNHIRMWLTEQNFSTKNLPEQIRKMSWTCVFMGLTPPLEEIFPAASCHSECYQLTHLVNAALLTTRSKCDLIITPMDVTRYVVIEDDLLIRYEAKVALFKLMCTHVNAKIEKKGESLVDRVANLERRVKELEGIMKGCRNEKC